MRGLDMIEEIILNAKSESYSIYIQNDILNSISHYTKRINGVKNIFIVTDGNVFLLYFSKIKKLLEDSGYNVSNYVLKAGEGSKSLGNLETLYSECIKNNITRSDLIIALGGGVVGDITGFLAATYLRGVPLIQIPTTLLSQVDSSVGGKVAVNLESGKNLVGAFYQPKIVLIDPTTLSTLSDTIFSDGLAEAIKYAFIKDASLLKLFSDSYKNILAIIKRCVIIKKDVVQADEFDKAERMILNFGHTIGHTIEKAGNYKDYTHGQAVAIGMIAAAEISVQLGFCGENVVSVLKDILKANKLPLKVPYRAEECLNYIQNDKKMEGATLNAILLKDIGECVIHKIKIDEFIELARKSTIFN
jgi:3-dehydroquinate synthase